MASGNRFPSWGSTGESPPDGFQYEGGDQVNEKHLDYLWDAAQKQVDDINTELDNLYATKVDEGDVIPTVENHGEITLSGQLHAPTIDLDGPAYIPDAQGSVGLVYGATQQELIDAPGATDPELNNIIAVYGVNNGTVASMHQTYSSASQFDTPEFVAIRGRGTLASPEAVQSGDRMGRFDGRGVLNTAGDMALSARIQYRAPDGVVDIGGTDQIPGQIELITEGRDGNRDSRIVIGPNDVDFSGTDQIIYGGAKVRNNTVISSHSNVIAGPALVIGERARGDKDSPAVVQNDDVLVSTLARAYNGADYVDTGFSRFRAKGVSGSSVIGEWEVRVSDSNGNLGSARTGLLITDGPASNVDVKVRNGDLFVDDGRLVMESEEIQQHFEGSASNPAIAIGISGAGIYVSGGEVFAVDGNGNAAQLT